MSTSVAHVPFCFRCPKLILLSSINSRMYVLGGCVTTHNPIGQPSVAVCMQGGTTTTAAVAIIFLSLAQRPFMIQRVQAQQPRGYPSDKAQLHSRIFKHSDLKSSTPRTPTKQRPLVGVRVRAVLCCTTQKLDEARRISRSQWKDIKYEARGIFHGSHWKIPYFGNFHGTWKLPLLSSMETSTTSVEASTTSWKLQLRDLEPFRRSLGSKA